MSRREHLSWRAFGLVLLAIAALWPRSHAARASDDHDRAVAGHVIRGQFETAGARPLAEGLPRPRSVRLVVADSEETPVNN